MGNTASSILGGLDQVIRYDWDEYLTFPEDAYIMGFNVPSAPVVSGDTALCASVESVYQMPNNGSIYDFVVTGGTVTNQTGNSITVIWDNDSLSAVFGNIQVIETVPNTINGGCTSLTRNFTVEVWPLPVANFTVVTDPTLPGGIFVHDILEMADSSILTSEWYWDFGDGVTSTDSLPFHSYYETGTYDITLIVRSGLECLDTLIIPVNVVEGLIVPNVFTPNNDGWNDVFDIRTSGVGPFKLEIYNRWGNVVFENSSPLISWDGTTAAGVPASAGTYFYVISKAEMLSGNAIDNELNSFDYKETGWLQLIR
jgi:gliding motility-associated-like protein